MIAMPTRRLPSRIAATLLAALLFVAASASAQLIDSVDVSNDGANAIVRIKFGALIQYLRHAPASEGSLVQMYFQITARDAASEAVAEERRFPPPNDLLPQLVVTYPVQPPGIQRRLDINFGKNVRFRLRPEDARTIVLVVPLTDEQIAKLKPPKPEGVQLAPSPVSASPQTDVEREAATLSREARSALEAGEFETAVTKLNQLLNLPPTAYSQEAQEQIGIARDRLGETAKAKAEYELYLKVYPDGPAAERVRQRLAALAAPPVPGAAVARPGALSYWGSVSMYYYGGQSQTTTSTTTPNPATGATSIDTSSLSSVDQRQLVTNVDLAARYRDANWDSRVVVRDSLAADFLRRRNLDCPIVPDPFNPCKDNKGTSYDNRLTAAYFETKYQPAQLMGRFGRQSATAGGVIGRFDGAVGQWGFYENWRGNAVVGQTVDATLGGTKTFYGASVEAENLGGRWGGNVFAIRQTAAGYEDRVGVGGEVRYFDSERNVYALLDYDPVFKATNIGMIQANWQFPTGTGVNVLYDYRRAPTLQLTNALVAFPSGTSVGDMVQSLGMSGARDLAKTVTPVSRVAVVGVTQQLSPRWQVGGDVRLSTLSSTPATGDFPGLPASGNVYTYTLQVIANSFTPYQDILVLNGNFLTSTLFDAQQFSVDYRITPWANVTLEPMLRYYQQSDNQDVKLTRWTPGLKLVWLVRDRLYLEAEGDWELAKTKGPIIDDSVTRTFYYVGVRWDL